MNAEKLDKLTRLAGRLTGELKTQRDRSTNAFPFNILERFINWLFDQAVAAVDRLVMRVMPKLVRRVPQRVQIFLLTRFGKKPKA